MMYKEECLSSIEEWDNNEWTLNFYLCYNIPTDFKMQTALCREVTVPQVLLKSLAVPHPSCICSWERTQLLFYFTGNSLCKTGMWWSDECGAPAGWVQALTAAWLTHPSSQPGIQLDLPCVWLRNNLLGSRQMHLPDTYVLHVLFKALRYIYVLLWFA